jgi:hypothetical protein
VTNDPLRSLVTTYGSQSEDFSSGGYCESLNASYTRVDQSDPATVVTIKGLGNRAQAALQAGSQCAQLLAASDQHFRVLASALSAVDAGVTRGAIDSLVNADKALTQFDRSRPSETVPLAKLQSDLAASDNRITQFMAAVAAFQRTSPQNAASYQNLVQALQQVEPDRDRLTTAEQESALTLADEAARQAKQSVEHFARLGSAMSALGAEVSPDLMDAAVAIEPTDLAMASDDQKRLYAEAQQRIAPAAWKKLADQLQGLRADAPATYTAAADTYRLLKTMPGEGLSDDQRRLLDQGRNAEQKLAASDARLAALQKAADSWQSDGVAGGDTPLAAWQAVNDNLAFDRPRFQLASRNAWATLSDAKTTLQATKLTPGEKDSPPICVLPATDGDKALAADIASRLQTGGFNVAGDCKFAALTLNVAQLPLSIRNSQDAYGNPITITVLPIQISGTWANGTAMPAVKVEGSSESGSASDAPVLARADALVKVTPAFAAVVSH